MTPAKMAFHELPGGVTQDEVNGKVDDGRVGVGHEGAEDRREDEHHEQRVQDAPENAEGTSAVFELEVLCHELPEDEPVLLPRRIPGILT